MVRKTELVSYTNKFGTHVSKEVPLHHHVGKRVASHELKRAKQILKIDNSRFQHAKSQLKKAEHLRG